MRRALFHFVLILAVAASLAASVSAPATAAPAEGVVGVWLSPDWILPGPRVYTEDEVRRVARRTLQDLKRTGVNAVFLETWLRGYSIAPGIEPGRYTARVLPFEPGRQGLPVYRHFDTPVRVLADEVQDPLQIFIDEGRDLGIDVHAWMHAFYWKMDNSSVMLPWHAGPSMWNDLVASWLRREATRLEGTPGAAPATLGMMREAADLYDRTSEDRELEKILEKYRVAHGGHPMGALIRQAMRAGAASPDFLLISSAEEPFPSPRGKHLRPVFVNPEHPEVRRRLRYAVDNLAKGHPGLAGIHLDHIRYPVDGQGLPEDLGIQSGSYNYYTPSNAVLLARYRRCHEILRRREASIRDLVNQVRQDLDRRIVLSAAVLPLYYRDRDNGRYRLSGYDFACQDWYGWDVDFVVPMLYEFHPWVIRGILKQFAADQQSLPGHRVIPVFPGVSRWQMARSGILDVDTWVFFDLTLARDVKFERQPTEDTNFGPQ